jgi:para-nitrobenzyl esterase
VYNDIPMWPNALSETVSTSMNAYWARFAASGDPNGGGAPAWPAFSATNDQRMQFGDPIAVVDDFRAAECTVWRTIYDAAFVP